MNSAYKNRVEKALQSCNLLSEVDEVEEAIKVTEHINRRTKDGRELTQELLTMCHAKAQELINNGEEPF